MSRLTDLLARELRGRQPCLEVGVGTGRLALPLRERGIAMVGADSSGAMLRQLVANAGGDQEMPPLQSTRRRPDDAGRITLRQEAGAPWSCVVRESARRHGTARPRIGAHDPAAVPTYLGARVPRAS